MNNQEVNKVIAAFMGYETNSTILELAFFGDMEGYAERYPDPPVYTESLDALAPAIEKYCETYNKEFEISCDFDTGAFPDMWHTQYQDNDYGKTHDYKSSESGSKVALTVATSLAKAIQEIQK